MQGEVQGFTAPGYGALRDAFAGNFADHAEVGAALCVYHRGEPVVDLWGGLADRDAARPWAADTLVLVFSVTKGLTAVCLNHLVERGALDPTRPVAEVWPEFAANDKAAITVEQVCSHQAGLPYVQGEMSYDDTLAWHPVVERLAAQAPVWEPGHAHGYHMRTYGWLVGEIIRRVSGRTVGDYLRDEIAAPLGAGLFVGLPAAHEPRVARLVTPGTAMAALGDLLGADHLLTLVGTNPGGHFDYDDRWNTRARHEAELPSSNGIVEVRGVARLYASLIGEVQGTAGAVRTLQAATVAEAVRPRVRGADRVLMIPTSFGLGFMLPPTLAPGAPPGAFGHGGAGGSMSLAHPDSGIAMAYAPNRLRFDAAGDPRQMAIMHALARVAGWGS